MRILIAPNTFKGSLDALEVARSIARGLAQGKLSLDLEICPIADGGDGTLPIAASYFGADLISVDTVDALGRPLVGRYGWSEASSTALIELAEASGIRHLRTGELNPWKANTYGTGLILEKALLQSPKHVYLTIGGSASIDGAVGLLEGMGIKFLDKYGKILHGLDASRISEIEGVDRREVMAKLKDANLKILCDVENPLLGAKGSAEVFGPQKGANQNDVEKLENALAHLSDVIKKDFGIDIKKLKHGGAAGGVAAVMYGVLGAELIDGANFVLNVSEFRGKLKFADLVITGEGKIDVQTLSGKGPGLAAVEAKKAGKRVIGFCGVTELTDGSIEPFDEIITVNQPHESLEDSIKNTQYNLEMAAKKFAEGL
ncbi:MAG: glycerate kinase [Cyclobacteriaceae bacterium]